MTPKIIGPHDWTYYVGCVIAVLAGFLLLLSFMRVKEKLTWNSVLWQFIVSSTISYLAYFVHEGSKISYAIEIWLFLSSLLSSVIAKVLFAIGRVGVGTYFKILLGKFIAEAYTESNTSSTTIENTDKK